MKNIENVDKILYDEFKNYDWFYTVGIDHINKNIYIYCNKKPSRNIKFMNKFNDYNVIFKVMKQPKGA